MAENRATSAVYPAQADSDETLLRLWLDGRSLNTRRVYEGDSQSLDMLRVGAKLSDVERLTPETYQPRALHAPDRRLRQGDQGDRGNRCPAA